MLKIFGKKKLSTDQVANIFVNGLLESVEKGWPIITEFIKDSPEFATTPEIDNEDYGKFLMIVIAVNYHYIPEHFEADNAKEIIQLSVHKFAHIFGLDHIKFASKVKNYKSFLNQVNGSQKKLVNSMGKGVIHKYNLIQYQDEFFINLNTGNPILIKNLDELMMNYIWDWDTFKAKYKLKEDSANPIF